MKDSTIYIKLDSRSYETGDYRSGGTTTAYFKVYCCKKCNHGVNTSDKFCPRCGTPLNGKIDDYFKDKCSKLLAKRRRERTKILKTVNGDNYYEISKVIEKLDKEIDCIEYALFDWKHWNHEGSLPMGYNTIMKEPI